MASDDDFMMEIESDHEMFSGDENQAAKRVQSVKAAATEKPPVLGLSTNATKKKTVEETYQKKTPLEHILIRPDTYSKFEQHLSENSFVVIPQHQKLTILAFLLFHLSWIDRKTRRYDVHLAR